MANRPKGDAKVTINGEERIIRLTLGAIAEIEDELDIGLAQLGEVMGAGKIKPISVILYWMLRAGGWSDLKKEDMLTMELGITELMPELKKALSKFTGKTEEELEASEEESEGN